MERNDWKTLTIRMPRELHDVIRSLAFHHRYSINNIMIQTLAQNVTKTNFELKQIEPDIDYEKLLDAARAKI